MNGIWYYIIAFFIIWLIVILFKGKLENYGVVMEFPIILWKTKRFRGFINSIAQLSPRFWKTLMNFGVLIGYIGMIIMFSLLIYSTLLINEFNSISLILPGVEVPGSPIYIPFAVGIFALATVLIVHEFAHGIITRAENIELKSIGLALFAILPGAFVEPDEEAIKKAKKITRTRIYAAGSVANIALALIALICMSGISTSIIPNTFHEDGVEIKNVFEGSPADGKLAEGMLIKQINGINVKNSTSYFHATSTIKPNSKLNIVTNKGVYNINTTVNPTNNSRGYIGIGVQKKLILNSQSKALFGDLIPYIWIYLLEFLNWVFMLNISVGLFNLIPMKPFDGGHMFYDLISNFLSEKNSKIISTFFTYFLAILIISSLLFGMLKPLFMG